MRRHPKHIEVPQCFRPWLPNIDEIQPVNSPGGDGMPESSRQFDDRNQQVRPELNLTGEDDNPCGMGSDTSRLADSNITANKKDGY